MNPDDRLLGEFNRFVPCYCGRSVVVSRRPAKYDRYAACSHGCFLSMVSKTDFFEVTYGQGS